MTSLRHTFAYSQLLPRHSTRGIRWPSPRPLNVQFTKTYVKNDVFKDVYVDLKTFKV